MASEYVTMDEALATMLRDLAGDNQAVTGYLTIDEQKAVAAAYGFNEWAQIEGLRVFLDWFVKTAPSRKGFRSKQLTQIGIASMRPPPEETSGILNWFRRRGGD